MSDKNRGQQLNNPSAGLSEGAVAEMLPAYVLGALEMDEMLAVDDFLAAHPALLVRVAELEATADQLALAAPEVEAPAAAKAGLMGRVQADASVRSMLSAMETAAMETAAARPILAQPRQAEAALPAPALQPSLVVPRPPQREAPPESWIERLRIFLGGNFFWPSLAAGSMTALLLIAVYAAQSGSSIGTLSAQLTDAQQRIAQLENEMNSLVQVNRQLEQQLANDRNQLAIFANAERVVALAGTPDAPGASGAFYTGPESGLLVLRNLPPPARAADLRTLAHPQRRQPHPRWSGAGGRGWQQHLLHRPGGPAHRLRSGGAEHRTGRRQPVAHRSDCAVGDGGVGA